MTADFRISKTFFPAPNIKVDFVFIILKSSVKYMSFKISKIQPPASKFAKTILYVTELKVDKRLLASEVSKIVLYINKMSLPIINIGINVVVFTISEILVDR